MAAYRDRGMPNTSECERGVSGVAGVRVPSATPKGAPMSGEMDQMKGRVKQAAGDLTDDAI